MVRYKDTLWCDGCGIEITWIPFIKNRRIFCCRDCAEGLKCDCTDFAEETEYRELKVSSTLTYNEP
jgi:hypothetical protein